MVGLEIIILCIIQYSNQVGLGLRKLLICTLPPSQGTFSGFHYMFYIFLSGCNSKTIQDIKFKFSAFFSFMEATKCMKFQNTTWAPSSEFVSSSIPSWQILTAHAQPFRGARDLAFCLKVPLDSLLVWASSGGSGETAWMRRLAWTFAARIGDKYQIRLTRST